jgi:hypothetical protein
MKRCKQATLLLAWAVAGAAQCAEAGIAKVFK